MALRVLILAGILLASRAFEMEEELFEDEELMDDEEDMLERYETRSPAPNVCNGGSALLNMDTSFEPCRYKDKNDDGRVLKWMSPVGGKGVCNYTFSSQAPGFLKGIYNRLALEEGDKLAYIGAFGDRYEVTNDDKGTKFRWATTFGRLEYSSNVERNRPMAFLYTAQPRGSNCQKVIYAPAGSNGRITSPMFDSRNRKTRAKTMCQWWIKAPEGKKITLNFNAFEFGERSDDGSCKYTDYIGIDKSGDPWYMTNSQKICGDEVPEEGGDIVSDDNKINVLMYGKKGGDDKGFCLTYKVSA